MRFLIVLCCLLGVSVARPWNISDFDLGVDVVSQVPSPLMKTIDSMTVGLTKGLKTASPSLTPLLSVAGLGYLGYIASVMFVPTTLKEFGVPLLDDFKFEPRTLRTSESGFIDSLATGFMKDMIGRTEVADILRNTSINAVKGGMGTLKKTTRFLNNGIGSFLKTLRAVETALSPECISRTMCQVGQITNVHIPAIGPILRSINTFDLDDYSQALIDGTTIGDCNSVFFGCPLFNED